MTRVELAPEVFDDFDRFFDHISELGAAADASQRIGDPISARWTSWPTARSSVER